MKIGLLGGSFNPIHKAHIAIAQKVISSTELEEIWFIPTGKHPLKKGVFFLNYDKRMELIETALQSYPKFFVKDFDAPTKEYSYTSELIKRLSRLYPLYEFYFIIGEDNVVELPLWYNYKWLLENIIFIVINRPNCAKDEWKNLNFIDKLFFLEMKPFNISSRDIRDRIGKNEDISDLVPTDIYDKVIEYYS